jgi:hypothetical protein
MMIQILELRHCSPIIVIRAALHSWFELSRIRDHATDMRIKQAVKTPRSWKLKKILPTST